MGLRTGSGRNDLGCDSAAGSRGWRVIDGRKWGKTGISQEGWYARFFWIVKEHFGFLPRTRWFFFRQAPRNFNRRVFESAR